MASTPSLEQENQNLGNVLTCPICLDYFNDPRVLPCSHTYCLACMHIMAANNHGQFECPMRDGTTLRKTEIDSLPTNRIVRDMVDILPTVIETNDRNRETSLPECHECTAAVATLWCINCAASYCETCCTSVHKGRALSQHQRVPMKDKPAEPRYCKKHAREELRYWCSCDTVICRDCQLSKQHKEHTPTLMDDVAEEIAEELKARFKEAQTLLRRKIEAKMSLKNANDSNQVESITRTFDVLRKMINDCEKKLKDQIREIDEKNSALAENYLKLLNDKQETLSKKNGYFEEILSTKDHIELLKQKKELTIDLEQGIKELKGLKKPATTTCRIEGVDQLSKSIKDILDSARIIEQKSDNPQFAAPGIYKALGQTL